MQLLIFTVSIFDFRFLFVHYAAKNEQKSKILGENKNLQECKNLKITKIDLLSRSSISFLILDMAGVGLSQESASLFFQAVLFWILRFYKKNIDFKYDS